MTRAKKIVQTGVRDYLTQIFAIILYKPRTLYTKLLDWLCSQKTHIIRDTGGERDRQRKNGNIMYVRKGSRNSNVAANAIWVYSISSITKPLSAHASASFNLILVVPIFTAKPSLDPKGTNNVCFIFHFIDSITGSALLCLAVFHP